MKKRAKDIKEKSVLNVLLKLKRENSYFYLSQIYILLLLYTIFYLVFIYTSHIFILTKIISPLINIVVFDDILTKDSNFKRYFWKT